MVDLLLLLILLLVQQEHMLLLGLLDLGEHIENAEVPRLAGLVGPPSIRRLTLALEILWLGDLERLGVELDLLRSGGLGDSPLGWWVFLTLVIQLLLPADHLENCWVRWCLGWRGLP